MKTIDETRKQTEKNKKSVKLHSLFISNAFMNK